MSGLIIFSILAITLFVTVLVLHKKKIRRLVAEAQERFRTYPVEMEVTKPELLDCFNGYNCMTYDFVKLASMLRNPALDEAPCKLITDTEQELAMKAKCPVVNHSSFECPMQDCGQCRFMIQYAKQAIGLWLEKNSNFDIMQLNVIEVDSALRKDIRIINKMIENITDRDVIFDLKEKVNAIKAEYSSQDIYYIQTALRKIKPYSFGHGNRLDAEKAKCDEVAQKIESSSFGWWKPMISDACSRIRAAIDGSDSSRLVSAADKEGLLIMPIQSWDVDMILHMQDEYSKLPDKEKEEYSKDVNEIVFALFTYYKVLEALKRGKKPSASEWNQIVPAVNNNPYLAASGLRLEFYTRGWID